jgi:hypothetical protein
MTNASSTYLGIAVGGIIGGIISWWIYNGQKRTSEKQDEGLSRIKELEGRHEMILKSIEQFERNQAKLLDDILNLDNKIDSLLENQCSGGLEKRVIDD